MGTDDPPIMERDVDRPARSERAVALGPSRTPRTAAVKAPGDDRSKLVLKALTDEASVRIRVNGEITNGRFADGTGMKRDGDVAISRIDEKGGLDTLRFTGDIVEFEILEGDVEVTLDDETVDPVTLDLPNEIGLEALTDEAEVRIKVSGKILEDRFAGDTEILCDGHIVTGRIDEQDGPNQFRFSGDVVEFKVLKGDVNVTVSVVGRDP